MGGVHILQTLTTIGTGLFFYINYWIEVIWEKVLFLTQLVEVIPILSTGGPGNLGIFSQQEIGQNHRSFLYM